MRDIYVLQKAHGHKVAGYKSRVNITFIVKGNTDNM